MFLSKEFTIGAGTAIVLSLLFSHPAFSASTNSGLSIKETIAPWLHQGDLVRLRSGGPLMTVSGIKGDQVECVWTDWSNGQPDDATFPAQLLQKF
jgi:uncharacterized protein YodC (DUF2158 family)